MRIVTLQACDGRFRDRLHARHVQRSDRAPVQNGGAIIAGNYRIDRVWIGYRGCDAAGTDIAIGIFLLQTGTEHRLRFLLAEVFALSRWRGGRSA